MKYSATVLKAMMLLAIAFPAGIRLLHGEDLHLELRSQQRGSEEIDTWARTTERQIWAAPETAVIVCDVWDKHHCLNAVHRLEEFAPRMNEVLKESRRRGATIIHSPSDCMPAYEEHPARQRAIHVPQDKIAPNRVQYWCSKIPAEELSVYPIDQSDGGCDDDPAEHAKWAAELTALGRDPGLPWKMQSPLIEIDSNRDFISDKGDEVWNILQSRGIKNVILVGVHTNMCVLGRPFGLRQMARNGKNVVLMRDMTDCMYNPKCWPFVNHFTGNDLIISHVERFVCPTITSDQILKGKLFRSRYDNRENDDVVNVPVAEVEEATFRNQWSTARLPTSWKAATRDKIARHGGAVWIRCTIRLSKKWLEHKDTKLVMPEMNEDCAAWMNGVPLTHASDDPNHLMFITESIVPNDINLLVIRMSTEAHRNDLPMPPAIINGQRELSLNGRWQFRIGDDPAWSNIPLPAKFGIGSDILFEPQ